MVRRILLALVIISLIAATPMTVAAQRGPFGPQSPPVPVPPIPAPPVSAPPVVGQPVDVPPVSAPPVSIPPVTAPLAPFDLPGLQNSAANGTTNQGGQQFGIMQRALAWTMGRFFGLAHRLGFGVTPFMVMGTIEFVDGEPIVTPNQGNRWALEALGEDPVWILDEAVIRVVYTEEDLPSVLVDWEELEALVSECPEATVQFFGTVDAEGNLQVSMIIVRVPCASE
jgi:hypothetical protein